MRTIIAGSRSFCDYDLFCDKMGRLAFVPSVVLSGCARGVDGLGETWATENNIQIERYPAEWELHGRRAGFIRNSEMADRADALIAIWDMRSRGTANMIFEAARRGLLVIVFVVH